MGRLPITARRLRPTIFLTRYRYNSTTAEISYGDSVDDEFAVVVNECRVLVFTEGRLH